MRPPGPFRRAPAASTDAIGPASGFEAIDNTTRTLLARGRSSLGVGFFFSLGHSSVVVALVAAIVAVGGRATGLTRLGGSIGASVSGTFLLAIGLLNLGVLLDLLSTARRVRAGDIAASEIALLAPAAGAAGGSLPVLGVLALPLLFSAGMVLLDSADGVLMTVAYGWAVGDARRRLRTNGILTGLSVAVALAAGLYQVARLGSPLVALTLIVLLTLAATVVAARSLRPARTSTQSS